MAKYVYQIHIIESERGWGQRVDEIKEFDTYEKARDYRDEYNGKHNNEPTVPDWYMVAMGPYEKLVEG